MTSVIYLGLETEWDNLYSARSSNLASLVTLLDHG